MKEEWRFKISSELKNILGRDLITDSNIAILELVKNSFDAHATEVTISFENDQLTIADNGKGMSEDDIQNKWLFVAYSAKKDGTEDNDYRDNIKRKYAGAKGIGRLSCDRLGRYLTLLTKTKNSPKIIEIEIDWNDFEEDSQKEFNGIILKHRILEKSSVFKDMESGTVLRFTGLRDHWTEVNILKLRKSLEKLINPFNGMDEFTIIFNVPSEISNDRVKKNRSKALRQFWDKLSEKKQTETVKIEKSIINGPISNTIADTLNLKTTRIDSFIKEGVIRTILSDRGTKLYEIEESNKFPLLENAAITLFYLNKQAKYNFSIMMGVPPVNYGSVFLFRNGFRIMPYGEFGDDSWGLDQRAQQGYNRFLGTRSVLGRVDVESDNPDEFKEVSSRDGGLINSSEQLQLKEFFYLTLKRLERYVVGVLWGEGFLRRDYFSDSQTAQELRDKLQNEERESQSIKHVLNNIGSKVDFLQIVKTLVDDSSINLLYYNDELANIVSNITETEIIQNKILDDFRKVANATNDHVLLDKLLGFEKQLNDLRKQKEEAERIANFEKAKAKEALKRVKIEKELREQEEEKRKHAERERDAQIVKNKYLNSMRETSPEVEDLIHTILISSTELDSLADLQFNLISRKEYDHKALIENIRDIKINIDRINMLSSLITKADAKILTESKDVDILEFTKEFLSTFARRFNISIKSDSEPITKKISILEYSMILMNLLSNSGKADAKNINIQISKKGNIVTLDFSDDGIGVDLNQFTNNTIFEVGVTNRKGGSGIGLSTVKKLMQSLNGEIHFLGNNLFSNGGATFRLIFE